MRISIEVKAETAKQLQSLAAGKGVSVDELIRVYIPGISTSANHSQQEDQAAKIESFIAWAKSHSRSLPPLPSEAVSRKSYYED
ncbi:MAG: CopG family transcriptional regulator [Verrucomicrobiales bacterium]|nr:CopG family transcriptional regulator [Verrucomicrobiales bacterium]